jgi:membrane protein DedA with SNARE-associated domain
VPGETAVLVAGFLASPAGGTRFDLCWVIALMFAAAILGDNHWLGWGSWIILGCAALVLGLRSLLIRLGQRARQTP